MKAGRLTREAIGHITTGKKLTIAKAIDAWVKWMQAKGTAPKTINNNLTTVKAWMHAMKLESQPPSVIAAHHISQWINAESSSKASTRAVNLAAIRSFFGLCCARGWSIGDPAREVNVSREGLTHEQKEATIREPFNKPEITRLLANLDKEGNTFWHFAVLVSSETGLRLGDICQLEWNCFTKPGRLVIHTDKRNKRISA